MKGLVSVIIPVYNVEEYLRKCLDSVINQTYTNLEIICIDDGTQDNCGAILDEYAQKDSRIIVIHQENAGVAAARNRGLDIAKGEYIAFVDSDDWLEPECYETMVKQMEENPDVDLVSCGVNIIDNINCDKKKYQSMANWYTYPFSGKKELSTQIGRRITGAVWQFLFKSILIKNTSLRFSHYKFSEDLLFIMKYISNIKKIYFNDDKVYNYVQRQSSAMTKYGHQANPLFANYSYISQLEELYNFYKSKNNLDFFYNYIFRRYFNTICYTTSFVNPSEKELCIQQLEKIGSFLDNDYDWGKEITWIRNKEFYRFKQLKIPYFSTGNNFFGFQIYRTENPHAVLRFCGLKISINYQKIFSLKNDRWKNHKVINLLGLRFKFSRTKKFKEYIKSLPQKVIYIGNCYKGETKFKVFRICGITVKHKVDLTQKIKKFVENNNKFLNRSDKTVKRRLFLTTGNLSLLNNLTVIKQLNEKNCEDVLFIHSHIVNEDFIEYSKTIASTHNFEKIYYLCKQQPDCRDFFIKNKLTDFDEIYFSNLYQFILVTKELYPNARWILTDEGLASLLAIIDYCDYDKVNKLMVHNYLDKIDYFGLDKHNANKIIPLDKKLFQEIAAKCAQFYPVDLKLKPDEKAVLFCGSWWEVTSLSKDDYMELQNKTIEKLTNMGYKVLFKPHPRDPRNYINNPNITVLTTRLPLECYNLDIVAVISMMSSASLQSLYFQDIPGFNILNMDFYSNAKFDSRWLDILFKKMLFEYTMPIDALYEVNPKLYSKDELKKILKDKCYRYLESKPLLSQNKDFENFAREKGYFKNKEENQQVLAEV